MKKWLKILEANSVAYQTSKIDSSDRSCASVATNIPLRNRRQWQKLDRRTVKTLMNMACYSLMRLRAWRELTMNIAAFTIPPLATLIHPSLKSHFSG